MMVFLKSPWLTTEASLSAFFHYHLQLRMQALNLEKYSGLAGKQFRVNAISEQCSRKMASTIKPCSSGGSVVNHFLGL
jgi:hypothetical protein